MSDEGRKRRGCPYLDCTRGGLDRQATACPQCGRVVVPCGNCSEPNRVFAGFCRGCGQEIDRSRRPLWTGWRGGPSRQGLNRWVPAALQEEAALASGGFGLHPQGDLELDAGCNGLLLYDEHLIALSEAGQIAVRDLVTGATAVHRSDGELFAHATIVRGVLVVGHEDGVAGYPLAGLSPAGDGRFERLWAQRFDGRPIDLLGIGDSLFVVVEEASGARRVEVLRGLGDRKPQDPQRVHRGARVGRLAGDPGSGHATFLSESDGAVTVHRCSEQDGDSRVVERSPRGLAVDISPAAVGKFLLAVFEEQNRLCRIDVERGQFDAKVVDDARHFALSGIRDGAVLQSGGLHFVRTGRSEGLNPSDRPTGSLVIVRGVALLAGLEDGRFRWYSLDNPAFSGEERLSRRSREPVRLLAAAGERVVAGDAAGNVVVYRIGGREARGKEAGE